MRGFASAPGSGAANQGIPARVRELTDAAFKNRFIILTIGGATIACYGFYRVTMKVMGFLLNVSDATIFNIGFMTGIFTAACAVAAAFAMHRYTSLSVEGLRRAAFAAANADPRVAQHLGKRYYEVQPPFRATVFEPLRDAVFGSERRARSSYLELPARRCQLMFQVQGEVHDGMIAVEGFKRNGEYTIESMAIFVTDTGETVHLMGDPARRNSLFQDVFALKKQAKKETSLEPPPA